MAANTSSSGPSWAGPGPLALNQAGPRSVGIRNAVDHGRTCGCSIGAVDPPAQPGQRPLRPAKRFRLPGRVEPGALPRGGRDRPRVSGSCRRRRSCRRCRATTGPSARSRLAAGPDRGLDRLAAARGRSVPAPWPAPGARARRPSGPRAAPSPGAAISRCCWAGVIVFMPVAVVGRHLLAHRGLAPPPRGRPGDGR